jgi:hypothetical protein
MKPSLFTADMAPSIRAIDLDFYPLTADFRVSLSGCRESVVTFGVSKTYRGTIQNEIESVCNRYHSCDMIASEALCTED